MYFSCLKVWLLSGSIICSIFFQLRAMENCFLEYQFLWRICFNNLCLLVWVSIALIWTNDPGFIRLSIIPIEEPTFTLARESSSNHYWSASSILMGVYPQGVYPSRSDSYWIILSSCFKVTKGKHPDKWCGNDWDLQ